MSRVYGKRGGKSIRKPEKSSELDISPVKENLLEIEHSVSSVSFGDDETIKPLISPFQSPINRTKRKLVSPNEGKIKDAFELTEEGHEAHKNPSFIRSTRSLRSKKLQSPMMIDEKSTLNSFFIESQNKPTWSPKKGPKSPEKNTSSHLGDELPEKSLARRLTFGPRLVKPPLQEKEIKPVITDDWDFLDLPSSNRSPPKKRLFTKSLLRPGSSPKKATSSTHEHQVLKYYSSQSLSSDSVQEANECTPETQMIPQSPSNPITGSPQPQLKRTLKTYGNQRSFLVEKERSETINDVDNETNDFSENNGETDNNEEIDGTTTKQNNLEELQTISHLRAQGQNAQSLDELIFILEGLETPGFKIPGLLDLCFKLFDPDFRKVIKDHGLPELHNHIDENDMVQRMLLGFILCTVSEGANSPIPSDNKMILIIKKLLQDRGSVKLKKSSKSIKSLFEEFKQNLDQDYDNVFFGLALLFQNSLPINDEIYQHLANLLIDNIILKSKKSYQIILILIEKYLNNDENVVQKFDYLENVLKYDYEADLNIHALTLKLLIVLSVKKPESIYQPALVDKALRACSEVEEEDIRLLYFGLLINLIENDSCFRAVVKKHNISLLHSLYTTVGAVSSGYFALLVGYIYIKEPISLITHFDRHELEVIQLYLQRFDSGGSKTIQQQVDKILQKFKI